MTSHISGTCALDDVFGNADTGESVSDMKLLVILNLIFTMNQLDQDMVFVEYRMHHGE
jgi:hypothetical protein